MPVIVEFAPLQNAEVPIVIEFAPLQHFSGAKSRVEQREKCPPLLGLLHFSGVEQKVEQTKLCSTAPLAPVFIPDKWSGALKSGVKKISAQESIGADLLGKKQNTKLHAV